MFKKLISNKIFWVFVLAHLLLFNINYAEWGDSYRILRASNYVRSLSYPQDEKRQPLYSAVLAVRPANISPIFWGRIIMFLVSLGSFAVFYFFLKQLSLNENTKTTALILFAFNPVFFYWSLRIYADVFFAFLVLLIFYLYEKWQTDKRTVFQTIVLGLLTGLAILTRFEGFLLAGALGLVMLFEKKHHQDVQQKVKTVIVYAISAVLLFFPWIIYRNPLNSKYLDEPSNRTYNLKTLIIYLSSLFYLFGFTSASYFVFKFKKNLRDIFKKHKAISIFIIFELILVLVWPAAIPRLFVPIIPLLIIFLASFTDQYFRETKKEKLTDIIVLLLLLGVYVICQYFLRLQFLVLIKSFLVVTLALQLINISSIYLKKRRLFEITLAASLIIWTLATIWLHKDIFKAVVKANLYVDKNLHGKVAYNDVSSVSDWYLNISQQGKNVSGFYLNMDSREGRSYQNLDKNMVDYVMITNEHNPTLEFEASETDYLEQIKEFRYTIRGTEFFTKILKFNKK